MWRFGGSKAAAERRKHRGLRLGITAVSICFFMALFGVAFTLTPSTREEGGWTSRTLLAEGHSIQADDHPECKIEHRFVPASKSVEDALGYFSVVLYAFGIFYMFCGLAIICDDFFVASLEMLSERLKLSEDVAGATFMAAGSSAPELFTSVAAVFGPRNDIGLGTIVGSAVFNILVIIGSSGIFAKSTLLLDWKPLFRDSVFYSASVLLLTGFFVDQGDNLIHWWESLIFLVTYASYVTLMAYNDKFMNLLDLIASKLSGRPPGNSASTGHTLLEEDATEMENHSPQADGIDEPIEEMVDTVEEDEDKPTSAVGWMWHYFIFPYQFAFKYTVPNCSEERWKNWYLATFLISILWIGLLSYLMVEWATRVGCMLNIASVVMGLTVLAAGTSIPDAMGSILVAKMGKGDMAVSNAIGSNVFDILLGLGFPWFLSTFIFWESVHITSKGVFKSLVLLFAVLVITVLSLMLNKWQLSKRIGIFFCSLYVVFCVYIVLSGYLHILP